MVQGNGHHQQSPRYRASPFPMVRMMWTLVASLRKELRRRRITLHSTSVDGMPRGGAESGHARSGELKLGRGGTHARHTPPTNMTCSDATFKIFSR